MNFEKEISLPLVFIYEELQCSNKFTTYKRGKHMKKKGLSVLILSVILLFGLFTIHTYVAAESDWIGYTPISSQSDLAKIKNDLSGKYYLTQSILISGTWTGIGTSAAPFTGIFDGDGKTISFNGATVTGVSTYTGGLFNYVKGTYSGDTSKASSWTSGIVKNFIIDNVDVESNFEYTGGAVGFVFDAYVGNVKVLKSKIDAKANFTGGIIGGSSGTDLIEKCYNGTYPKSDTDHYNGDAVKCTGTHSCSGGIVGMAFGDSYVKECYNYGSITGTACDGGIVGHLEGSATVRNCINYGTLYNNWRGGGIVGWACVGEMSTGMPNYQGSKGYETIENCANFGTTLSLNGTVSGISNPAGIGAYPLGTGGRISNCYTVNQGRIYLNDGNTSNFIAADGTASQTLTNAFMTSTANTESDIDANTVSFTSLIDELNSDVMNCSINKTITTNMLSTQTDAGTNQWFFWTLDMNSSSPSFGYPVFTNSFSPTSRGGSMFTAKVVLTSEGETYDKGDVITLRKNNAIVYTLVKESEGVYTCDGVESGLYDVYAGDVDTGVDVSDGSTVNLYYYSVKFAVSEGISAVLLNGQSFNDGNDNVFVENTPIAIDATVADGSVWTAWMNTYDGGQYNMTKNITALPLTSDLDLTAITNLTKFNALVNVYNGDGVLTDPEDTVTLKQDGVTKYTISKSSEGVYACQDVIAGTYQLYVGNNDTGRGVFCSNMVPLYYYAIILNAGEGISGVKLNGSLIVSGEKHAFMQNTPFAIDATVSEDYLWSKWVKTASGSQYSSSRNVTGARLRSNLSLTAMAQSEFFDAKVNVFGSDGTTAYDPTDTLTLRQNGATKFTLAKLTDGVYGCMTVAAGTYQLYAGNVDTGIEVSSSDAVTLPYYTVKLTAGEGISAVKIGGIAVTSGEAHLYVRNTPITIDATVTTDYLWNRWKNTDDGSKFSTVKNITGLKVQSNLDLTAAARSPFFDVAVNVYDSDGATAYDPADTLTLRQSGDTKYTLSKSQDGVYTCTTVAAASYHLYAGDTDTDVIVSDSSAATLHYYTIKLSTSDGISDVKLNGQSVTSGTSCTYVQNASISIDATVSDGTTWKAWINTKNGTQYNSAKAISNIALCSNLDLTATTNAPYVPTAEVYNIDGTTAYDPPDTLTLRQNGNIKFTLAKLSDGVYGSTTVPAVTYRLYAGEVDTGIDVFSSNAVSLYYYAIQLTAGEGISDVQFTVNAETSGVGCVYVQNTPITIDATVADGYLWHNWTKTSDGSLYDSDRSNDILLASSLNLTANAQSIATYSIVLNTKGGTINSGNLTSYIAGVGGTLPTDITKAGATFVGWYTNSGYTGSPVTQISASETGSKTYYARWAYPVSGTISGFGTYTVDGITLVRDGKTIDADSYNSTSYSFDNVPAGSYDLIGYFTITPDGGVPGTVTVTSHITIEGAVTKDIVIPKGLFSSMVTKKGNDTPNIEAGGLDTVAAAIGGTSSNTVLVELIVEKNDNSANAEDVLARISQDGKSNGIILDVTLVQTVTPSGGDATTSDIRNLSDVNGAPELLDVVIHLPLELQGKESYVIYRYHEGAVNVLNGTPNALGEYIEVNDSKTEIIAHVCKFSTYAIAFSNTSTVSFDLGDDTSLTETINVTSGGTYGTLPTPTRDGYIFDGWYTSDGNLVTSNTIVDTSSDMKLFAHWTKAATQSSKNTYSTHSSFVTITSSEGGTISPSGNLSIPHGSSQTFTIAPNKGYYIVDVLLDGKSVGAVSSYTLSNISADHTITARFAVCTGLPYYIENGKKVFIGFADGPDGNMKYIAPDNVTIQYRKNPKDFTDISSHWAKSYIDFVTEREIFINTDSKTFSPDKSMTRGMAAALIGRLYEKSYGRIMNAKDGNVFTDVNYSEYYGIYVNWAEKNGIIVGVGKNKFEPDRAVTRQEMAAILYRFAKFLKVDSRSVGSGLSFADSGDIGNWAKDAAAYCQKAGIISGRSGKFEPAAAVTRAEVAKTLEKFIATVLESGTIAKQ